MIPLTDSFVGFFRLLLQAVALAAMLVLFAVYAQWDPMKGLKPRRRAVGFAIWAAAAFAISVVLSITIDHVDRPLARMALGTVIIWMLSALLFFLKVKWLRVYALMELAFATVFCAGSLLNAGDRVSPVQTLGLFAGVYVIIRGLDNFKKDRDARATSRDRSVSAVT